MYEISEEQIKTWWDLFVGGNNLVEVRLLGKTTYSGYFRDVNVLIEKLRPLLNTFNPYDGNLQAYFTLNRINGDLYSREQRDTFVKKPKSTTADDCVERRIKVMIDLDPKRAAGISSSDDELEKSHIKAVAIYRYLLEQGFKEPIITISGSGYHLYLPCDMPNDEEHNELVKRFLQSMSKMFSDECIELDEKVFNPARVSKVVGTWAKKGADGDDRRWRMAKVVRVPQDLSPNDDALFQKIADLLPKEEPQQAPQRRTYSSATQPFDLPTWLNNYGIKYKVDKQGASTRYTLEECPWIELHSDRKKWDSALFVDTQGKITFNCQHSHCKDKTWHDVRLKYEPDAYTRQQAYTPQQFRYRQPQKKYEIKEEIPELGEKWLSMSSIKKVDLTKLEKVLTGYTELDRRIGGLYMSEVTVLSGGNASGKSSWLNSVILNIVQQNYKVALWSGEIRSDILKTWIQMVAAGKDNMCPSKYEQGRYYVPESIGQRIDQWLDGKLFIYNNGYGTKAEQIMHDIEILTDKGVRVFVLDNLMSLDVDLFGGDKNTQQKELILKIKAFAMEKQVHIVLVAHPRKTLAFLRKADISGTSDITNAVDNVFILHRNNQDFIHAVEEFLGSQIKNDMEKYGNVLSVEKNRLYGVVDYLCGFHYCTISRRFKNTELENIKYGWELEPQETHITFQNQAGGASDYTAQENALQGLKTAKFGTFEQQAPIDDDPFSSAPTDFCPF